MEWRWLHNEELYSLYLMIKYRRLIWIGHVARVEEPRSVFKILTGKPIGWGRLEKLKYRWEDNIRTDLK